jgi:hypothetical protein
LTRSVISPGFWPSSKLPTVTEPNCNIRAEETIKGYLPTVKALQARIDRALAYADAVDPSNLDENPLWATTLRAALSEPSTPSAVEPETPELPTTEGEQS